MLGRQDSVYKKFGCARLPSGYIAFYLNSTTFFLELCITYFNLHFRLRELGTKCWGWDAPYDFLLLLQ